MDGLLGLGTTAGRTHSQTDALVALQQHLDLNPNSAQVRTLDVQDVLCAFLLLDMVHAVIVSYVLYCLMLVQTPWVGGGDILNVVRVPRPVLL